MSDKAREKKLAEEYDAAFIKFQESASSVPHANARAIDALAERLTRHCMNPFCNWPISALREEDYGSPDYGNVCATCAGALQALGITNIKLKNHLYFRRFHEDWVKENADAARLEKERRRRLGLDGDIGGFHG